MKGAMIESASGRRTNVTACHWGEVEIEEAGIEERPGRRGGVENEETESVDDVEDDGGNDELVPPLATGAVARRFNRVPPSRGRASPTLRFPRRALPLPPPWLAGCWWVKVSYSLSFISSISFQARTQLVTNMTVCALEHACPSAAVALEGCTFLCL